MAMHTAPWQAAPSLDTSYCHVSNQAPTTMQLTLQPDVSQGTGSLHELVTVTSGLAMQMGCCGPHAAGLQRWDAARPQMASVGASSQGPAPPRLVPCSMHSFRRSCYGKVAGEQRGQRQVLLRVRPVAVASLLLTISEII